MRRLVTYLITVLSTVLLTSAAHASSPVVDAFGEACLPERLSFEKSIAHAANIGWTQTLDADDPELERVMSKGLAAVDDPENPDWEMVYNLFYKQVEDKRLYLVMTRFNAPKVIALIGCYIYDFNAIEPIKQETVSKVLNHTLAYSSLDKNGDAYANPDHIISFVWGPPPSLPRQFDTYLSFIPEGSPFVEKTGFSGLVLKSSASEPPQKDSE